MGVPSLSNSSKEGIPSIPNISFSRSADLRSSNGSDVHGIVRRYSSKLLWSRSQLTNTTSNGRADAPSEVDPSDLANSLYTDDSTGVKPRHGPHLFDRSFGVDSAISVRSAGGGQGRRWEKD